METTASTAEAAVTMPKETFDVLSWPAWRSKSEPKSLEAHFQNAFSLGEMLGGIREQLDGSGDITGTPSHQCRSVLQAIASGFEKHDKRSAKGYAVLLMYENSTQSGGQILGIRVLGRSALQAPHVEISSSREADLMGENPQPGPVIVVEYTTFPAKKSEVSKVGALNETLNRNYTVSSLKVDDEETMTLLCGYLEGNTQRISPAGLERLGREYPSLGPNFKYSFLSVERPPVSMAEEVGQKHTVPCYVCKTMTTSYCSSCKGAAYCSRECQRCDWKNHKKVCGPKDSSSSTAPASQASSTTVPAAEETDQSYSIHLLNDVADSMMGNKVATMRKYRRGKDTIHRMDEVTVNIHGQEQFIVKIQAPTCTGGASSNEGTLLIYDAERSFNLNLDPKKVPKLLMMIRRHKTFAGNKAFFYTKREGKHLRISYAKLAPDQTW